MGEDEQYCAEQQVAESDSRLLIALFSSGLGILLTVCTFFILRRWKRNRRMREEGE